MSGRGGYLGGSTVIGPRSVGWFSNNKKKSKKKDKKKKAQPQVKSERARLAKALDRAAKESQLRGWANYVSACAERGETPRVPRRWYERLKRAGLMPRRSDIDVT